MGRQPYSAKYISRRQACKNTALLRFFCLVLLWIAFHCCYKFYISVLIRCPSWNYAPKMYRPIADFSKNYFYFSALNNSNNSPVFYRFRFFNFLFMTFNYNLFYRLFKFLKSGCYFYQFAHQRQKFKPHYLR